jgi:2-amino-4-hydroxy-6-hydroxymethyldihydropteridine diphosphokinase
MAVDPSATAQATEKRVFQAYVALGSNLADPIAQVRAGAAALAALPDTHLDRCSALYRTTPVGSVVDQPHFINAACRLKTGLSPATLLTALLDLEARQGRVRTNAPAGGPRILDLDLLIYDGVVLETPGLTLPHPRLHERAFVLYPLADIDPALVIPGRGPVRALLAQCEDQGITRLDESWWNR